MNPLTQRERFCRLYDGQPVDRSVRWEAVAFWGQTLDEWKQAGTFPKDANAVEHYQLEPPGTVSGGLGFCAMALSGPKVQHRMVRQEGDTAIYEDDLGKVWRDRLGGTSMPQWIRFAVESPDDWARKIKPRLDPAAHDLGDLAAVRRDTRAGDRPWGLALVGLYAFWRNFWGEEKLAYAFYDFPETLHDMADTWLRMHLANVPRLLAAAQVEFLFLHEDMAFKNGPLIGPDLFREFMMPYYRQLMPELRRLGLHRVILDSDGNNGKVLDLFMELGVNGLYPFEAAAGYDVIAFRKRYPEFFVFGGLDKRCLLKDKEAVKRHVLEIVPAMWEKGRFLPSIDHAIPPCPQENFECFLELVRGLTVGGR